MVPNDEMIPFVDEIKFFSLEKFNALPNLTIARNAGKRDIGYPTDLSVEEYDKIWSWFKSGFGKYKKTIFMKKQTDFCYAGMWSMHVDLAKGEFKQCLQSMSLGDAFANPDKALSNMPACSCHLAHCYNGHALLTMGLIPDSTDVGFGDIRNRVCEDGSEWLQTELKDFFNTKLKDSNEILTKLQKICMRIKRSPFTAIRKLAVLSWLRK